MSHAVLHENIHTINFLFFLSQHEMEIHLICFLLNACYRSYCEQFIQAFVFCVITLSQNLLRANNVATVLKRQFSLLFTKGLNKNI